jgi:hypothetical protein
VTSLPEGVSPDTAAGGLVTRGLPAVIAWLLIAAASVGMFVSSPPSAGPDEPVHELTAWYLTDTGPRSDPGGSFSAPVSFAVLHPCFAELSDVTASCSPARSQSEVAVPTSTVLNYPPPYYWAVGLGQRLAAAVAGTGYADIGGRLASLCLNLGALVLISLYMRRRSPLWGTFLLLVSTPMAVFLGSIVNPSGWEVTCGVVLASVLYVATSGNRPVGDRTLPLGSLSAVAVASVALALARPIGFFWVCGLTMSAIALAPAVNRRLLLRLTVAVAPGVLVGLIWYVTHTAGPPVFTPAESQAAAAGTSTPLAASFVYFPMRLMEMLGVLGWLDTPMPVLLVLSWLAVWAAVLRRMPSIGRAAMLCGIFGILIAPSLIEATISGGWPFWWQGRYTMPFALGFLLLLLLRSGWLIPRTVSLAAGIAVLSLGLMVWVNAVRYGFGLNDFDLPASLATLGLSPVRLAVSAALGSFLVAASGYLLRMAWKMSPDPRPGPPSTRTPPRSDSPAAPASAGAGR